MAWGHGEDFTFFVDGYTFVTQLLSSIFCFQHEWKCLKPKKCLRIIQIFVQAAVTVRTVPFAARICRWFWSSCGEPMRFVDHLSCILPDSSSGLPLWTSHPHWCGQSERLWSRQRTGCAENSGYAQADQQYSAPWAAVQWGFMAEGSRLRAPGFELAHFFCQSSGQAWQLFLPVLFEGLLSMLKSFVAA